MGLLVDRGVGSVHGVWLSSIADLAAAAFMMGNTPGGVSALHAAQNAAMFVPIVAAANLEVKTAWWLNGATVNGNTDVGIYDKDLNRLGSTGAVAQSGTTAIQSAALAIPAMLRAGQPYYLALATSSATATYQSLDLAASLYTRALGLTFMAAAYPLPAAATPGTAGVRYIPIFGLTYRTAGI